MIHKMTRYSIIAFQPELMDFLDRLQELGVMDITRSFKATDETSTRLLNTEFFIYNNCVSQLQFDIFVKCRQLIEQKVTILV
jgi:hypothetical protein